MRYIFHISPLRNTHHRLIVNEHIEQKLPRNVSVAERKEVSGDFTLASSCFV